MQNDSHTTAISVTTGGDAPGPDANGMLPMQQQAYRKRGEQYILVKAPPAAGKSRAVMFIALDKMNNQGIPKTIVAVPEMVIGSSFASRVLTEGTAFPHDWEVEDQWNLCTSEGSESGKVATVGKFLEQGTGPLVCTHATLRFAFDKFGAEAFDDSFVVFDEIHHASANPGDSDAGRKGNQLGRMLRELVDRGEAHVAALTGSYFRGDGDAILTPEYEEKFENGRVTYTYYERLSDCRHLKQLDIGYRFNRDRYDKPENLRNVIDPNLKTIIHIPHVGSRESTGDKMQEVGALMDFLGKWEGVDHDTGFQLVRRDDGRLLRIADLVDDNPNKRTKVRNALLSKECEENPDHLDMIIALGMAKEGFDWIWCEHAVTIGYRSSLTEIIQIIGRTTRDAEGKPVAKFTNMIVEPQVDDDSRNEAVTDTLKAIGASMLMIQVMAPKIEFFDRNAPTEGLASNDGTDMDGGDDQDTRPTSADTGKREDGGTTVVITPVRGGAPLFDGAEAEGGSRVEDTPDQRDPIPVHFEGFGATTPRVRKDINEHFDDFVSELVESSEYLRNMARNATRGISTELENKKLVRKIIDKKRKDYTEDEKEYLRQAVVAKMGMISEGMKRAKDIQREKPGMDTRSAFIAGVRKLVDVRDIDMEMIDRINPFSEGCDIVANQFDKENFQKLKIAIANARDPIDEDERQKLCALAIKRYKETGVKPNPDSKDPWEARMARALFITQNKEHERRQQQ